VTRLRDGRNCRHAWWENQQELIESTCREGLCTVMQCPQCLMAAFDFGPIDCPHKKNENDTLRWYRYPDMDEKPHVPVKRSKDMRKRNQPR